MLSLIDFIKKEKITYSKEDLEDIFKLIPNTTNEFSDDGTYYYMDKNISFPIEDIFYDEYADFKAKYYENETEEVQEEFERLRTEIIEFSDELLGKNKIAIANAKLMNMKTSEIAQEIIGDNASLRKQISIW